MIPLAINILLLLIGVIVIFPERVEQGIGFIIFLLVLIGALSLLATGSIHGPTLSVR